MKIFTKTFFYTLALLVLVALIANGLIYALMPGAYIKQKQHELTEQADELIKQLNASDCQNIVSLMKSFALSSQSNIEITVGDHRYFLYMWDDKSKLKDTVYESFTINDVDELNPNRTNSDSDNVQIGIASAYVRTDNNVSGEHSTNLVSSQTIKTKRSFIIEGEEGELKASIALAPVDEAVSVIVSLFPLSLLICIIVAVVFSLLYARAITRPIKAISEETRRMTTLNHNAKCSVRTKDEIGALASNVNDLYTNLLNTINSLETELDKTGAVERAKTNFLRAASHELKTPVTALSIILDNIILGVGKYKNHEEWLPKCRELVDSLSDMLREILSTSRLEDVTEEHTTQSIKNVYMGIIEPYIMIARAKGLFLYIDWSASFTVTAPPKLLGKALSNILSNAVRYTNPGGRLAIYCRDRSLFVENECAPIPQDQIGRLYEPFYRPDESRSRETGGNGLGLYITDTVLRLLRLDYIFEPMISPEGMRFTINF